MNKISGSAFIFMAALSLLLPVIWAGQAGAEEQATPPTLTPAQAKRTLSILQDDAKRAELEQTLRAIAQATAEAPLANTSDEVSAPAATSDSDQSPAAVQTNGASSSSAPPGGGVPIEIAKGGLVAQVFDLIGERLHIVGNQLRTAVQTLLQIRTVGDWWQHNLGVPERRAIVLEALLEAALILGGGLFAEWVLRRALRHPRRMIEDRAAVRQNAIDQQIDRQRDDEERAKEKVGPEKEVDQAAPHLQSATSMHAAPAPGLGTGGRATAVDRHWSLLRRFPFALGYWLLELVPIGGFVAGATLLLTAFGGRSSIFYTTTIPLISAYATTRIALSIGHLMASPVGQRLRLMHISDEAANFLNLWLRRIVIVAVFGTAIADIALETGATLDTHNALSKLVALIVHIMLLIMVFRSRKEVAAAIRGSAENSQVLAGLRRLLADSWLFVATFFIVGAWLLGSMGTENGFQQVLHIFALSAVVIISASLASIFVLGAIDRAFIADRKNTPEQQGQQLFEGSAEAGTKSPYHLLIHRAVSLLITVVTGLVLLRVWGVDTLSWFESGSVGRRVASAVVTITVTCALALAAWESLNTAICRRIDRWGKAGDIARAARLRTLLPMLRTTMSAVFIMIVLLAALDELGITIAPLLAGASIIGVALGFGSQKLVQDFITGIFLLMENAIQVGDFITVADLSGSVEHLSIRTVRLRAPDGALHVVPFSSVSTVTNTNRGLGNASIRISVTADSDVEKVFAAIRSVVDDMRADPHFKDLILSDADIWGVDQMDGFMITILGQIRTLDKGRWPVQRGFNLRILERFRESNIRFVNPQERQLVIEKEETGVGSA
jgi:small-conductance mechanosensitive channel